VLNIEVKGEPIELALWDTTGRGDYEEGLRPPGYPGTHSFLICFLIDQPDSLENAISLWYPHIRYFGGEKVPLFLVGCKKDVRNDEGMGQWLSRSSYVQVTTEQGKEMAKVIGAEYF